MRLLFKISFFLLLSLLNALLAQAASEKNLVANSSFEDGMTRPPLKWGYYLPPPAEKDPHQLIQGSASLFSLDSTVAHSGSRSLQIVSTDLVRCSAAQKLPALPGQKLRFSVWMKGEDVTTSRTQGAWVRLNFTNKSNPEIDEKLARESVFLKSTEPTFDWTLFKTEVTVPENATAMNVECYLWQSKGTVWFDDISTEVIADSPNP